MHLPLLRVDAPAGAQTIADRMHRNVDEVEGIIETMVKKALAYVKGKGASRGFALLPLDPGVLDFTAGEKSAETGPIISEIFAKGYHHEVNESFVQSKAPVSRVFPTTLAVASHTHIEPYDDVVHALETSKHIVAENAAHAVILAVEYPQSGGRIYNISDESVLSAREWITGISEVMGHDWEIVYMPWSMARPVVTPYINNVRHRVLDISRIKTELDYRDRVPTKEGIRRIVLWLLDNRPPPGGEVEQRLKDSFSYDSEDRLIEQFGPKL